MKSYQQKGNRLLLILNQRTSQKILISNVVLIKGNVNYTTFYLKGGQKKVVARTIKFFEEVLQEHGFLRIHRAYMINPNQIQAYDSEKEMLIMTNGELAFISRRRKNTLSNLQN